MDNLFLFNKETHELFVVLEPENLVVICLNCGRKYSFAKINKQLCKKCGLFLFPCMEKIIISFARIVNSGRKPSILTTVMINAAKQYIIRNTICSN